MKIQRKSISVEIADDVFELLESKGINVEREIHEALENEERKEIKSKLGYSRIGLNNV